MKKPETSLLVAASDYDANMLYAVGMFVPLIALLSRLAE